MLNLFFFLFLSKPQKTVMIVQMRRDGVETPKHSRNCVASIECFCPLHI